MIRKLVKRLSFVIVSLTVTCAICSNVFAFEEKSPEVYEDDTYEGDQLMASAGDEFVISSHYTYRINDDLSSVTLVNADTVGSVVIPSTVSFNGVDYTVNAVGDRACYYPDRRAIQIILTDSVTKVGNYAFGDGCRIRVAGTLEEIGEYAFENCKLNSSIQLSEELSTVGKGAFAGTYFFYDDDGVTLPQSLSSIPDSLFEGSTINTISIPKTVTSIGESAFANCVNLTSIDLPNGLTSIGYRAFYGCERLTEIVVPDSVSEIYNRAFASCSQLESITFPISATLYASPDWGPDSILMLDGDPALTTVKLSKGTGEWCISSGYAPWKETERTSPLKLILLSGIESVPKNAFQKAKLNSVEIPGSVKSIGSYAFNGCELNSLTINEGVEEIGTGAFWNCGLSYIELVIPSTVKTFEASAFAGCFNMTGVKFSDGIELACIPDSAFYGCTKLTSVSIPYGVESIGKSAFSGCSKLASVSIPNTVDTIGDSAFSGCSSLRSISIPAGVTSIGKSAFNECSMLNSVILPDTLETLEEYAFYNCSALSSININTLGSLESIGRSTFQNCSSLSGIISIPSGVDSIGEYAFYDCTNLGGVDLPDSVKSIGKYAFWRCSSLTSINIPDGVETIKEYTFWGCSNLATVGTPSGIKTIEEDAFFGCGKLTSLGNKCRIKTIGKYGFGGCSELTSIGHCNSIQTIGDHGLWFCKNLTWLGDTINLESIGDYAFSDCAKLSQINLRSTSSIGSHAFDNSPVILYGIIDSYVHNYADNNGIPYVGVKVQVEKSDLVVGKSTKMTFTVVQPKSCTYRISSPAHDEKVAINQSALYTDSYCMVTALNEGEALVRIYIGDPNDMSRDINIEDVPFTITSSEDSSFDISFIDDKGRKVSEQSYCVGIEFGELPELPNKLGSDGKTLYDPVGWFTLPDGKGEQVTDETICEGNLFGLGTNLYGKWKIHSCTVEFDPQNGESAITVSDVDSGTTTLAPAVPVKENSSFMGWYTRPDGKGERYTDEMPIYDDTTFYAYWSSVVIEGVDNEYVYSGGAIKPQIRIYENSVLLTEGKDYTLSYSNNTNVADKNSKKPPTITVRGKGNYNQLFTDRFSIVPKPIGDGININEDLSVSIVDKAYNKKAQYSKPTIKFGKLTLKENKDYKLEYDDNVTDIGTVNLTVSGMGNYKDSFVVSYRIYDNTYSMGSVFVDKIDNQIYTGQEIELADLKVYTNKKKEVLLTKDVDYIVKYSNNINVGTATAVISGIGDYGNTKAVSYKITAKPLSEANTTIEIVGDTEYTGATLRPAIIVKDGETVVPATNYSVSYGNNTNVANKNAINEKTKKSIAPYVTVSFNSNYSGKVSRRFSITPHMLNEADVSVSIPDIKDNGRSEITDKSIKPTIKYGKKTLTRGKDYTIAFTRTPGKLLQNAQITFIGNYNGGFNKPFMIYTSAANIADNNRFVITPNGTEFVYTGAKIMPAITVTEIIEGEGDRVLESGRDYTISYSNNTDARNAADKNSPQWTVKGKGAYVGTYYQTFTIKKSTLNQEDYRVVTTPMLYTGKPTKARVTVYDPAGKVFKSSNYTVSYGNNTELGENSAVVTVTGKGNYDGEITGTYRIFKYDISKMYFNSVANEGYTGLQITPNGDKVKVFSDKKKTNQLTEGVDYLLSYGQNTKAGKGTVIITGIGEYGGSKTLGFTIVPKWLRWLLL